MAHSVKASGEAAEIRWAYYKAADLRDWSLERVDDQLLVSATVVSSDPMRLSQQPLTYVVPRTGWTWAITKLQIAGDSLLATLGPREG